MGFGFNITIKTPKNQEDLDEMKAGLAWWFNTRFKNDGAFSSMVEPLAVNRKTSGQNRHCTPI